MNNDEKFFYLLTEEWKETATFLDKTWYLRTQNMYCNWIYISLCMAVQLTKKMIYYKGDK